MKIHPWHPLLRFMYSYDDVALVIFFSIVYTWLFLP